ncbi:MAG: class I SAM-dependent RNA methyltransferase [Alphaproteobacteria bacterium]|nr:class I SAM-dependent RNA methyltransferase [Alphaproteobacteria bacterium]
MKPCPLFSICGGCKYDFAAPKYRTEKQRGIADWNLSTEPFWTAPGCRRRADFCFSDGVFGFYARASKDIIAVKNCPNLVPEINAVLPKIAALPWTGTGSALITSCENGLDLAVTADVPYFTAEFKHAAERLNLLRVTRNGACVVQRAQPQIRFGNRLIDYPSGAFLQPTVPSETAMRDFVIKHTAGARRVLDLFCGLGNFTFATHADGFDIAGTGVQRDLFKRPLSPKTLNNYDVVIMDPPRAGALEQCRELAKSNVKKIIYVSCNPITLRRDSAILINAGYRLIECAAFDQFVGSEHWEIAAVFEK